MRLLSLGLLVLIAGLSGQVNAHQQKASLTQVLLNERSGYLEVAHRFYLHDAEHAARQLIGETGDILSSEPMQQAFYQSVLTAFSLAIDGNTLDLTALGFEIEGAFFWVYQEIAFAQTLSSVEVSQDALHWLWPEQINTVNVHNHSGEIQTAVFTHSSVPQTLVFTDQDKDLSQ